MQSDDKILADITSHLAKPDKPIAFLYGAGSSSAVKIQGETLIPSLIDMTNNAYASLDNEKFKEAWNAIKEGKDRFTIEDLLSALKIKIMALADDSEVLSGLSRQEIIEFESKIREFIVKSVYPDNWSELQNKKQKIPHQNLVRWIASAERDFPIEIFTLNYDLLFEHAFESERVPYFDGFSGSIEPFFLTGSPRKIRNSIIPNWTRLWKIHGSVNWNVVDEDDFLVKCNVPSPEGKMIFPSFEKYSHARQQPYLDFLERFRQFLEQIDAILIVGGYSFSDEHINDIISSTLEHNPRTHVFAFMFEEYSEEHKASQMALSAKKKNIVCIFPKHIIQYGNVKNISEEDNPSVGGQKNFGDFEVFTDFLSKMTPQKTGSQAQAGNVSGVDASTPASAGTNTTNTGDNS